jgi:lipoate-protein ligase A
MDAGAFRLLDSGIGDAGHNMACDEAILMAVGQGQAPPTIRFYAWDRPTLSIGYFQRAARDVDADEVGRRGWALVRRMTGGRAVLHDRELTYSIALPAGHRLAAGSVVESYRLLAEGLRCGYEELGLQAQLVSLANEEDRQRYAASSAACFDSPSWYELVVEGRKIAGSAQVRAHGGLLQHGALLLDLSIADQFAALRIPNPQQRAALMADFSARATSVKQLLGVVVSYEEAADAFRRGFCRGLQVTLHEDALTDAEQRTAQRLRADKYATYAWTFRR